MPFKPIQINTTTTPQPSGFRPVGDVRSIINQETAKQDFMSRVKGDIQQRGSNVVSEITNPNQNPILGGLKATAQGFGAIGDIAGEAFKSIAPDLSQKVSDVASQGFNAVTNKLSETPLIKGAVQGDTSNVEGLLQGLQAGGDIANNLLIAKGTADIGNKAVSATKELYKSSMGSTGVLPEQLPAEHPTSIYEKQALKDWKKPIEVNQPGFKQANAIYENATSRGNDISKTLVDNKIFLGQNIQDGKYLTSDSADILRTNAGEASKTYLRPALEIADYSTPPTPVTNVVKDAIKSIKTDKFIPIESKNTLIKRITKLQPELEAQYPNGMTLTNQLDEKILRDIGSKYSPVGDIATNLEAGKNKAIADALRESLIKNAPDGIPVDSFQKELSKMYQAADYLDTLNGKKVPQSLTGKITQTAAKVAGAVTGESLGGGILGGVGGYHLGGILENYFANMSNPFKAQFLENLQKVNPEAFGKIKEYIGVKELQSIMTPKLGPGTPLGTEKNPIITPAPTTYEAQAPIIGQRLNSGSVKKPITNIKTKVPKNAIPVKSTTSIPKVNSLISEAKKYKSAEEFVKAQGTPVYHGTDKIFKTFDLSKTGTTQKLDKYGMFFTSDKDIAKTYSSLYPQKSKYNWTEQDKVNANKAIVMESFIKETNPLTFKEVMDLADSGKIKSQVKSEGFVKPSTYFDMNRDAIKEAMDITGKDVFEITKNGETFYMVNNPEKMFSKSQLTDIWKKANKK